MIYLVFNLSILLLPISIYLISISYHNNYKKINKDKLLTIILIIQVILFIYLKQYTNSIILINIPLLISYLKRKELTSILLTILIVFYYLYYFNYPFMFIILEYLIYYVIYYYINHRSIKVVSLMIIFIFVKSIILTMEIIYFENNILFNAVGIIIFKMLVFYVSSYLIFIYLLRGEEIMNLNTAIKELEKEKILRTSLFKITHEIKNPIAVCKGYLDMLDINDKDKVSRYIPIIKGEIARTLTLMDDYLDYTKVKIEKDEVDIYLLLNEVIESLELFFKENKIELSLEIPDDELYLKIDYNRIKQVLVNMLKNCQEAKDLSKDKMLIKIRTRLNKRYFKIMIEDNGIGMDLETLNQVTDLFFTTKKNGTGLGTSLSKEIIDLHGGKIKYLSELGIGTIVTISLPL